MSKRILLAVLMLLAFTGAMAQEAIIQNKNMATNGWLKDEWVFFQRGEQQISGNEWFLDVKFGDTLYTATYKTYPHMYLTHQNADTNAAADSIAYITELWMWSGIDTLEFIKVKNLSWRADSVASAVDTIQSDKNYWCNVGFDEYPGLNYFFILTRTVTGHRVINPGVKFRIEANGHIF